MASSSLLESFLSPGDLPPEPAGDSFSVTFTAFRLEMTWIVWMLLSSAKCNIDSLALDDWQLDDRFTAFRLEVIPRVWMLLSSAKCNIDSLVLDDWRLDDGFTAFGLEIIPRVWMLLSSAKCNTDQGSKLTTNGLHMRLDFRLCA